MKKSLLTFWALLWIVACTLTAFGVDSVTVRQVKQYANTNRTGYFGPTTARATNREPNWQGNANANGSYALQDAWGNTILTIFPKIGGAGGYDFYWGSKTNQAHVFLMADTPRDGNEPRGGFNYCYDSGPLIGELHWQWAWRTNSSWWYNGEQDRFYPMTRVGTNGDLAIFRPFLYLAGSGVQLAGLTATPTTVGTYDIYRTNYFSGNATTGLFTNLVTVTNCPFTFAANLGGDEIDNDNYYLQLYSNGVAVVESKIEQSVAGGFVQGVSKQVLLTAPINTSWTIRASAGATRASAYVSRMTVLVGWP